MENKTPSKGLYMVLSVLIAIVAWSYVGNVGNPEETGTVRNLPVAFTGLEALEERGLMISSGAEQTVSLRMTGKRNAFRALSAETMSVTVNVSNITQAGDYTLSYQPLYNLPADVSSNSLVILERYPANVTFTVSRLAKREIPIRGTVTGSVAEGYQAGKFSFSPDTIVVRGEESVVNQIRYAMVTLDEQDMTETFVGDLPYTFYNYATDEPMDASALSCDVSLIRTTLPIMQIKEVGLTANLIYGGGADKDHVTCTISPSSLVVSGEADDLEAIKTISLGDFDLSKMTGDTTLVLPIPLPNELTNISGVSEATVEIEFNGLETAVLETENIELINSMEGYVVKPVTQACRVMIRGVWDEVVAVSPSQVQVVADLSDAVASSGTQTLSAKVLLYSAGNVGAVGDYSVVVSISKK